MSVQILIGALLIGDVPIGCDRMHHRATVGDGHRLFASSTPHPVFSQTPLRAATACRLRRPASHTSAAQAASSHASSLTHLVRPLLRHILMPPGI